MKQEEFNKIKKDIFLKLKLMDTTIKGIKESEEYKENNAYNQGMRDVIKILENYIEE